LLEAKLFASIVFSGLGCNNIESAARFNDSRNPGL
jgi:hypothetical protein